MLVKNARQAAEVLWTQSCGGERMFQERQHRHRCEVLCDRFGEQKKESAGRRRRQRSAGRIVDNYIPPSPFGGDTPCQIAVRRDKRSCSRRRLKRLAKDKGDGKRFFAWVGCLDQRQSVEP